MVDRDYNGPEKTAILLLSLGDDIAPLLFKHLTDQEIQRISNYMSYIRNIEPETVDRILTEFVDMAGGSIRGMVAGGKEYVRKLLIKSLDPDKAEWIINNLSIPTLETGLEALRWLDAKTIARFLQGEHPQTIAVIVAHLDSIQAGAVLTNLPATLRPEVILRIAKLERIPPGVVQELDKVLRNELRATGALEGGQVGGISAVAEILNNVDQASEREIMERLEEANASLAEEIRQLMFVFEDLRAVDDRGMQQILKEISNEDLTTAMKTASEELREKILRNMSQRAAEMLREELQVMGPVRISDVERAQQKITQIAKRLEAEGKIVLGGKGDNVVV
jgi:flagellar motor switch protein FliG